MKFWICVPFELNLPGDPGRKMRYTLLAEKLVERGHSVVVWSADINHLTKLPRPSGRRKIEGVEVRLLKVPFYRRNIGIRRILSHWVFAFRFRRELAGSGERPDLILMSMPPLRLVASVLETGQRLGIPVCIDVQDLWPETFISIFPKRLAGFARFLFRPLFQTAQRNYRRATRISAVSADYASVIGRKDLRVFGLSKELHKPLPKARRSTNVPFRLIYVGNMGVRYRMGVIAEGISLLRKEGFDVLLEIAGDGPNKIFGEGVIHHGYLDEQGLVKLLAACDVGLVPMRPDSCVAIPNKLVDYCEAGLAVISGLSLPADFGICYNPDSVKEFVTAVKRYLSDPELLLQHSEEARRIAEKLFDSEKTSSTFADFLLGRDT